MWYPAGSIPPRNSGVIPAADYNKIVRITPTVDSVLRGHWYLDLPAGYSEYDYYVLHLTASFGNGVTYIKDEQPVSLSLGRLKDIVFGKYETYPSYCWTMPNNTGYIGFLCQGMVTRPNGTKRLSFLAISSILWPTFSEHNTTITIHKINLFVDPAGAPPALYAYQAAGQTVDILQGSLEVAPLIPAQGYAYGSELVATYVDGNVSPALLIYTWYVDGVVRQSGFSNMFIPQNLSGQSSSVIFVRASLSNMLGTVQSTTINVYNLPSGEEIFNILFGEYTGTTPRLLFVGPSLIPSTASGIPNPDYANGSAFGGYSIPNTYNLTVYYDQGLFSVAPLVAEVHGRIIKVTITQNTDGTGNENEISGVFITGRRHYMYLELSIGGVTINDVPILLSDMLRDNFMATLQSSGAYMKRYLQYIQTNDYLTTPNFAVTWLDGPTENNGIMVKIDLGIATSSGIAQITLPVTINLTGFMTNAQIPPTSSIQFDAPIPAPFSINDKISFTETLNGIYMYSSEVLVGGAHPNTNNASLSIYQTDLVTQLYVSFLPPLAVPLDKQLASNGIILFSYKGPRTSAANTWTVGSKLFNTNVILTRNL